MSAHACKETFSRVVPLARNCPTESENILRITQLGSQDLLPFQCTWQKTEEICDDFFDNDCNGPTDQDDPACANDDDDAGNDDTDEAHDDDEDDSCCG